MKTVLHFDSRTFAKWSLAVIGSGWILGAAWFVFMQPGAVSNSYNSPQSQLAKCRTLMTSDARYQCTSEIMLAKDNAIFNKTLVIVLPPLGLLIGYLGVTRIVTTHRDRARSRAALAASRKRMAEWRGQLNDMRASLAARQTERARVRATERPTGIPAHLARRHTSHSPGPRPV